MLKMLKTAGLFLVLTVCIPGLVFAQDKKVLAKIGNKIITVSEFNKILSFYEASQKKMIEKNPQLKETILWQLVQGAVIAKVARDKGFDKKPEIKNQQELILNNFLASQYLQKEVVEKITLSEKEIKAYYNDHPEAFKTPESVKARHILILVEKTAAEADKKNLKAKAEGILARLKAGEDFAKLAEENSDDPGSKSKGGDLGFFEKGSMVPAFEETAFSLKPGELSEIVETEYGYHIIKVEEKKEASLEPYEAIKDKVKEQALQEVRKAKVTAFVEKALKEAKVEIHPELLQTQ